MLFFLLGTWKGERDRCEDASSLPRFVARLARFLPGPPTKDSRYHTTVGMLENHSVPINHSFQDEEKERPCIASLRLRAYVSESLPRKVSRRNERSSSGERNGRSACDPTSSRTGRDASEARGGTKPFRARSPSIPRSRSATISGSSRARWRTERDVCSNASFDVVTYPFLDLSWFSSHRNEKKEEILTRAFDRFLSRFPEGKTETRSRRRRLRRVFRNAFR